MPDFVGIRGRVTVGIPTYNRPQFAERAARSVLDQTYSDIELLVSDDLCPEDDSEKRIIALSTNGKTVRIIKQSQRLGLVGNFDACLRAATGEFFLLLGDDDTLHPTAIERLLAGFLNPPAPAFPEDIGLVWCPCNIVDEQGKELWPTPAGPTLESLPNLLIELWRGNRGNRLSGILTRTSEALQAGGFQARFGDLCDTGMWGVAALSHRYVACLEERLVNYTNHQGSTTSHSSTEEWKRCANAVHDALLTRCRELSLTEAEEELSSHRKDHLFGVILTILIQRIGQPKWIRRNIKEMLANAPVMLRPVLFHRLARDGWKLLRS